MVKSFGTADGSLNEYVPLPGSIPGTCGLKSIFCALATDQLIVTG
jgi:hypothetical protein